MFSKNTKSGKSRLILIQLEGQQGGQQVAERPEHDNTGGVPGVEEQHEAPELAPIQPPVAIRVSRLERFLHFRRRGRRDRRLSIYVHVHLQHQSVRIRHGWCLPPRKWFLCVD